MATPERAEPGAEFRRPRDIASICFASLAGPVAWLLGLEFDYSLVRVACVKNTTWPLHLVTLLTLALAVTGGLVAWRDWQRAGTEWPGEEGGPIGRTRFLAALGVMGATFFALVILAQWAAKLFLNPCMAI